MTEELIEFRDYIIRCMPMDTRVHGLCIMDEDGTANIYTNSRDTAERQRQAADHEIRHTAFDDQYLPRAIAERVNRAREKDVIIEALENEDPTGDTILRVRCIVDD